MSPEQVQMLKLEKENALLRATLREILRIDEVARTEPGNVAFEDALTGRTQRQYRDIRVKAELLVEE